MPSVTLSGGPFGKICLYTRRGKSSIGRSRGTDRYLDSFGLMHPMA